MRFSRHGADRLYSSWRRGSHAIGGDRRRSQPAAEARSAGSDRSLVGRPPAGAVCGAPDRRQPTGGMAMAATLHRGGCRRAVARQDAQARQEAAAGGDRGQNPGAAVRQAAPTSHSLDGPHGRQGDSVSLRAVQRVWQANRLQPHRVRTFKTSTDLAFAEKVEDVVGLYRNPPVHVVVSIDEKSQIQALDRTQPGLPMKSGKCGTMTHDYKRNDTT